MRVWSADVAVAVTVAAVQWQSESSVHLSSFSQVTSQACWPRLGLFNSSVLPSPLHDHDSDHDWHSLHPLQSFLLTQPARKKSNQTPESTVMERPLDQIRHPRASVSSVSVAAPTFPDMYHRPFQTARAGTPSPAVSREHSSRPSPSPTPAPLPRFPDHLVPPMALSNHLPREDPIPTVFGLPLKYVS